MEFVDVVPEVCLPVLSRCTRLHRIKIRGKNLNDAYIEMYVLFRLVMLFVAPNILLR